MNILITGGAGFVGSQLGYYLFQQGHKIFLLDDLSYGHLDNLTFNNKTFGTFIQDDVRNLHFSKHLKDIDVVFHFAAIAPLPVNQVDPANAYSVNVSGWANVLEACRLAKTPKLILASTSAVYENNNLYPSKEEHSINPTLTYSLTKKHAEELGINYQQLYGMDISILRFFNVYGPHHDFRRKSPPVIAYIIKCLMTQTQPILHSNGSQKRDYVYVEDICNACEKVIHNPQSKGQVFNLASGSAISLNEIYQEIAINLSSDITPIYRDPQLLWDQYPQLFQGYGLEQQIVAKETNKYSLGCNKKALEMLGWSPKVDIKQGLKLTVDYAVKTGL